VQEISQTTFAWFENVAGNLLVTLNNHSESHGQYGGALDKGLEHSGVRKQIVSPNPSVSVDVAHDRSEIAVGDESHRSFPAAAEDSRQRSRRRDHSVHMEGHTYCLLP
jgi:hypothetical protein